MFEINISSALRKRMLSSMTSFHEEAEQQKVHTQCRDPGIVREMLAPARKEVVKMLTGGMSSLFHHFKATPMYAVSLEIRNLHRLRYSSSNSKM